MSTYKVGLNSFLSIYYTLKVKYPLDKYKYNIDPYIYTHMFTGRYYIEITSISPALKWLEMYEPTENDSTYNQKALEHFNQQHPNVIDVDDFIGRKFGETTHYENHAKNISLDDYNEFEESLNERMTRTQQVAELKKTWL